MTRTLAIILNWNGLSLTAECCRSLLGQGNAEFALDVVVVDNGSTAHTAEELRAACPNAEIIALPKNLGFSAGNNVALRRGLSEGYDFFWLLNNDIVCEPFAFSKLASAASSAPNIAAVSAPFKQGSGYIPAAFCVLPPLFMPLSPRHGESPNVLSGASLFIPRAALEKVGLLDESFFFFFEDADWSFRARAAGLELVLLDEALVTHLGSATVGNLGEVQSFNYRRSQRIFLRKYSRHPHVVLFFTATWRILCDIFKLRFAAVRGTIRGAFTSLK